MACQINKYAPKIDIEEYDFYDCITDFLGNNFNKSHIIDKYFRGTRKYLKKIHVNKDIGFST